MGESGYQGWANYPTWAVALWIDNDQYMQNEAIDIATGCILKYEEDATYWMADELKTWMEEERPELGYGMMEDLLTWALEMVEWSEIAIHYLEAAREQASYE